uniref:Uncharacterized protein n=1 Tax=Trichogramma kaykai TaxID=54128 RepID=A0ABD2X9V9_9HYME
MDFRIYPLDVYVGVSNRAGDMRLTSMEIFLSLFTFRAHCSWANICLHYTMSEARRRPDSIYIHAHCTTRTPEKKMPKRVQKTTYFRSVKSYRHCSPLILFFTFFCDNAYKRYSHSLSLLFFRHSLLTL